MVAAVPEADSPVVLGRVVAPYGVKGLVRIEPFSEEPDALLGYARWWLRPRGSVAWREVAPSGGRMHSGTVLAQFDGVASREEAMALRGADIGVLRSELPPLAPGEMYWSDLAGMDVVNRQGVALGTVAKLVEYGAHPVLRVTPAEGADQGERLIPFVAAIVDRVDAAARRIDVDWQPDY